MKITSEMIQRLDAILGTGLRTDAGKGGVGKNGNFCVQSAVNRAMDLDATHGHTDQPFCVCDVLTEAGISMNDHLPWHNEHERAQGLRDYAIAELGDIHNNKYLTVKTFGPTEKYQDIRNLISNKLKEEFVNELDPSQDYGQIDVDSILTLNGIEYTPKNSKRVVKVMVDVCRELDTDGIRWLDEFNATEDKKAFLEEEQKKADVQEFKAKKVNKDWETRYKHLFPEIFQ